MYCLIKQNDYEILVKFVLKLAQISRKRGEITSSDSSFYKMSVFTAS